MFFNSFVYLTEHEADNMIFSKCVLSYLQKRREGLTAHSLLRLRQEVAKLIIRHVSQSGDNASKAKAQVRIYGFLLQGLSVCILLLPLTVSLIALQKGSQHTAHLKLQQEVAHWAFLEEEAKRKIVSAGQSRP